MKETDKPIGEITNYNFTYFAIGIIVKTILIGIILITLMTL